MADGNYQIPRELVNRCIFSIIFGVVTIAGYMVMWGVNDAAFKSKVLTELQYLRERVVEIGEDQDEHEKDHDYQRGT
jgi:hypothetical protein